MLNLLHTLIQHGFSHIHDYCVCIFICCSHTSYRSIETKYLISRPLFPLYLDLQYYSYSFDSSAAIFSHMFTEQNKVFVLCSPADSLNIEIYSIRCCDCLFYFFLPLIRCQLVAYRLFLCFFSSLCLFYS